MASETIVAVFHTLAEAEAVAAELRSSGINQAAVEVHNQTYAAAAHDTTLAEPASGTSKQGFWSWVLGEETYQDEQAMYDETISKGGAVVSVIVSDAQADMAYAIIEKHHPADIGHPTGQEATASPAIGATAAMSGGVSTAKPALDAGASLGTEGERIALAEEELQVGKRQVQTGTAKIRRYVVERPVEEQIRLRTETARIERRPITGTTAVPADAFSEKVYEFKETAEEAVVGKTARVVEEVVIGTEATERVETVRDTVRREELEVVQSGSVAVAGTAALPPKV